MPSHESTYGSFFKFNKDDFFINRIKTYPKSEFFVYTGSVYYNNQDQAGDEYTDISHGNISLYELNVGRDNTDLIHQFFEKKGSFTAFKTVSTADFTHNYKYSNGDLKVLGAPYPLQAGITSMQYPAGATLKNSLGGLQRIRALKNTFNFYTPFSPHYNYNYADRSVTGSLEETQLSMIQIPSIFYGSSIRKGSIRLKYYITGTLIAEAADINKNGELIQTTGAHGLNHTVGVVLYNEGFMFLTGATSIETHNSAKDTYSTSSGISAVSPAWIHFGVTGSHTKSPKSSYNIEFEGVNYVETLTMLAHADKGKLNFSNNPTFITGSVTGSVSPKSYHEHGLAGIANIVSSSYKNYSASFEPITYITKVGIYDENKNLIAIASLANPVKKTESSNYTFKLKLDI